MFFPGTNGGGLFAWLLLVAIGVIIYIINKNKNMNNINSGKNVQQPNHPAPGKGRSNLSVASASGQGVFVQKKKAKYSALSIFMAVVLFGILVMFGERLIFDLNRYINPVIDNEYTQWKNQRDVGMRRGIDYDEPKTPVRGSFEMTQDSVNAVASQTQIYYPAQEEGRYLMYKLIIHSAVIIPLFVLAFALFYYKRKKQQWKPLLVSFLIFAFWMIFHLLGETIAFVMNEYRNIAIYVILLVLGVIFASVTYFSQAKLHKDKEDISKE